MAKTEPVELTNMCMLRDAQGRYLVEDRVDPNWGGLVFPGGHVEHLEPFRDSMIREFREETGLTLEDPRLCGVKQFTHKDSSRFVVFFYRATRFSGEIRSSEEGEILWLTREEIDARKTVPGFYEMLRLFEDGSLDELYYGMDDKAFFL